MDVISIMETNRHKNLLKLEICVYCWLVLKIPSSSTADCFSVSSLVSWILPRLVIRSLTSIPSWELGDVDSSQGHAANLLNTPEWVPFLPRASGSLSIKWGELRWDQGYLGIGLKERERSQWQCVLSKIWIPSLQPNSTQTVLLL